MPVPQFLRNQPVSTDNLSTSVINLTNNTNASDNSFGVEHYPFSNTTADNGYHNTVTTPPYNNPLGTPSVVPPTTVANPILYGFQNSANIGLLQYSRGPSNAVPTPITMLHSSQAPLNIGIGGSTLILDFAGLTQAMFTFGASSMTTPVPAPPAIPLYFNFVCYLGAGTFTFYFPAQTGCQFQLIAAGTQLGLQNISGSALNNVYWNLQFMRIN